MSINSLMSNIARLQRDVADLEKKISAETKAENDKSKRVVQIHGSLSKTTSLSTLQSKMKEMQRYQDDVAKIQSKKADLSKKLADKNAQLMKYQLELTKEQGRERKRVEEADRKREKEQLQHHRQLNEELAFQRALVQDLSASPKTIELNEEFDVFISHASEDKDDFVRPLATELERLGARVWYDESTLRVGDSLRRKIDQGLSRSRFGVVVLSSSFFVKNWPQYELDGFVAREMSGDKVILPIWHKVSKSEVMKFSPTLADKVALNSSLNSIEEIALMLLDVLVAE